MHKNPRRMALSTLALALAAFAVPAAAQEWPKAKVLSAMRRGLLCIVLS